jgi:hypothetical protein
MSWLARRCAEARDPAALAAASAIPTGSATEVTDRAGAFNSKNDYVGSVPNSITGTNVTYVQYNPTDGNVNTSGVSIANANGVRVALESTNPHTGASPATAMISRLFLMPMLNLLGHQVNNTAEVHVGPGCQIGNVKGYKIAFEDRLINGRTLTEAQPLEVFTRSSENSVPQSEGK